MLRLMHESVDLIARCCFLVMIGLTIALAHSYNRLAVREPNESLAMDNSDTHMMLNTQVGKRMRKEFGDKAVEAAWRNKFEGNNK